MKRHVLLYGLIGGLLIAFLRWAEYRFLILGHSLKLYGGLVAVTFAGLGIWLGLKLTRPRETVVIKEVPVVRDEAFETETCANWKSSASQLGSWRSCSSLPRGSATARSRKSSSSAKTR